MLDKAAKIESHPKIKMTAAEENKKHKACGFKNKLEKHKIAKIMKNGIQSLIKITEEEKIALHASSQVIEFSPNDQQKVVDTILNGGKWYMYEYPSYLLEMWKSKECTIKEADRLLGFIKHNGYSETMVRKELETLRRMLRVIKMKREAARLDEEVKRKSKILEVSSVYLKQAIEDVVEHFQVTKEQAQRAMNDAFTSIKKNKG